MMEEFGAVAKKAIDGNQSERNSNAEILKIVSKYDDPGSVDKLSTANAKVDEVRVRLNDNITNLVQNQVNLDVIMDNFSKLK